MERFVSFLGLNAMMLVAWLMSSNRRGIQMRIVVGGVLLQFAFALFILRTNAGSLLFDQIGRMFHASIACVEAGSRFLFDLQPSSSDPQQFREAVNDQMVPPFTLLRTFAFGVLPTIVFFSSLMSVLYHLGIMQRIVAVTSWIMQKTLRTSGAETLSTAANIFVGQTEAPLVIRPYLASMTLSELHAVMVGGFANTAGGVLAAYVQMGMDAGHLVTASVISAPASLVIAKIMIPETEMPKTLGTARVSTERTSVNVIEAITAGATDGLKLAVNVGAMLLAFLSIIAMANLIIGSIGEWLGFVEGSKWTLERLLAYVCFPFAWIMGIPFHDCHKAGELIGIKTVANEFLAFAELARWMSQEGPGHPEPRTVMILTYALAGFANFSSIGIQIGGIGAIVPQRRSDLARLGFRAMIGGALAGFMTACVAGILL
jgi:CNT family concentrative nucleoside transporter